jgi:1,4-alpha-glucan branching enzyme
MIRLTPLGRAGVGAAILVATIVAAAQAQPAGARQVRVQDTLKSPVVADGQVKFQLYAPKASDVSLRTEGPAPFANQKLARGDSGVWTLSAQPPADLLRTRTTIDRAST